MITTDPELIEAMARCQKDTGVFCRALMPDVFYIPFSPLHKEIIRIIDSPAEKSLALAPRGIGKTSLARGKVEKGILFREYRYILYLSKSLTHAERQTENIKDELLSNHRIRAMFGDIRESDIVDAELGDQFSRKSWVAFGHTLVEPKGAGQQVRGSLWKHYRPDLIVVDDLEDDKEVYSEVQRESVLDWFLGSVLKCVPQESGAKYKIIYIDTLKHEDALPVHLMEMPDWESTVLSICDDNYKSLAPNFRSDEDLMKEVNALRAAGKLDVFYRERRNIAVAPETASFKKEYFRYMEEGGWGHEAEKNFDSIVLVDPAKTVTPQADESAVVGVSVDRELRRVYVRDVVAERLYPDEMYQAALDMCRRLKCRTLAVEVTSLNEYILQPVKQFLLSKGAYDIDLVELKAKGDKDFRIAALMPYYRQGQIYHNPTCCGPLEAQLMSHPRSRRKDIMDALAYVIGAMDLGDIYFMEDQKEPELARTGTDDMSLYNWRLV